MNELVWRAVSKVRRSLATSFRRRPLQIDTSTPLISFTFDDAPRSAFEVGGEILAAHGARATYYVSLGLTDSETEIGRIADVECMRRAVACGHELGCHTFDHLDAWHVSANRYIESVDANRAALAQMLPGLTFRTFAYPKSGPTLGVKASLEERFDCCRGGGQTLNHGISDRNLLKATFLDERAGVGTGHAMALIAENARRRGWLIFAAHEVAESGSQFRCTPEYFRGVVQYAVDSGAAVLPVTEALRRLLNTDAHQVGHNDCRETQPY